LNGMTFLFSDAQTRATKSAIQKAGDSVFT